ncbi:MAG: Peptidase, partial [Bacteroidetes bacterium]|nr:Peptidase [Bacteroidota bacterium]
MSTYNGEESLRSTIDVARELFLNYETFRLREITSRRFKQLDLLRWLQQLAPLGLFTISPLGSSAEGRTIPLLTFGNGPATVLLWSQMHGDEPTATMALVDLLNFLSSERQHPVAKIITEKLKVLIVPMLNPDGAERFQRRTAQAIDMNRDALSFETPEARLLKEARDRYQPKFGFNLHDQDPRYTVGSSKKVSTIALLAPALDDARSENSIRLAAKSVAAVFALVMQEFIPGHVSKYDDSFEPRAFGDNIQRWGTSTVLVESGGWPGDRDKMFIRKLNYVGLLSSLFSIASDSHVQAPISAYDQLPFSTKYLYDVVLRSARLKAVETVPPVNVDVGINIDENMNATTGEVELVGTILDVGDLSIYGAFRDIRMNGTLLRSEEVRIEGKL